MAAVAVAPNSAVHVRVPYTEPLPEPVLEPESEPEQDPELDPDSEPIEPPSPWRDDPIPVIPHDAPEGTWCCTFCTYINRPQYNIACEMCGQIKAKNDLNRDSDLRKAKKSAKSEPRVSRPRDVKRQSLVMMQMQMEKGLKRDEDEDLPFDRDLIIEQKEIEKELLRRVENERRIQEENKRLEEQQAKMMRNRMRSQNPWSHGQDDPTSESGGEVIPSNRRVSR
jgi:hypothetical protein